MGLVAPLVQRTFAVGPVCDLCDLRSSVGEIRPGRARGLSSDAAVFGTKTSLVRNLRRELRWHIPGVLARQKVRLTHLGI